MVTGVTGAGGQYQVGYHAAAAVGYTPLRDKTIGKAESAQPGGVGDVSLRPVGKAPILVPVGFEVGLCERGGGQISLVMKYLYHVLAQGAVKLLAIPAGMRPGAGRDYRFAAIG